TSYVSETKLKQTLAVLSSELSYSETGSQLICRSYRKLSPLGEAYSGNAFVYGDADYSHLFSFDHGKYIIFCERRFGPDIRGSMPDGVSITYFLERKE
ncbi:MAG: hypothetical protein ACI837_003233, partial [Crocinitomicaceae bacterium]